MKTFTNTSTKPYDRHYYKVELNGQSITLEDYEMVRQVCYKTDAVVTVMDYTKKGFK